MHVLASHCWMLLVLRGGGPGPNTARMTPRTHVLTHRTRSLQRSCVPAGLGRIDYVRGVRLSFPAPCGERARWDFFF